MRNIHVPISEKYSLTIEEAAAYFRIGENKLRRFIDENRNADWVLMNGNRMQIKRKQFEKILDETSAI
ncbi:MAG: excisionase [Clostridium sp.]|nr:excisionase [Clostridium sp.]